MFWRTFVVALSAFVVTAEGVGGVSRRVTEPPQNEDWSYWGLNGPANWCSIGYNVCCGPNQSPVALDRNQVRDIRNPFTLVNYGRMPKSMRLLNNGETVRMEVEADLMPGIVVNGGASNYVLDNVHCHWAGQSNVGSEHTIDGVQYAMECHFVHRNSIYADMDEALREPDGVLVLAVLYQRVVFPNNNLNGLISSLYSVHYAHETFIVPDPFPLIDLLPSPLFSRDYFHYVGSFTIPPCTQPIEFIVMHQRVPISANQLSVFQWLRADPDDDDPTNDQPLVDNHRPLQPLNDRVVNWSQLPFYS